MPSTSCQFGSLGSWPVFMGLPVGTLIRSFLFNRPGRSFSRLEHGGSKLKCVVNVLHLLGKTVGMDVVPHTGSRYSEMVLANPALFEWLQRRELDILRNDERLFESVQDVLYELLQYRGSAVPGLPLPASAKHLFDKTTKNQPFVVVIWRKI